MDLVSYLSVSKHMDLIHDNNEEPLVKCNHCGKSCKDKDEIKSHIFIEHKTYKPCKNYGAENCDSSRCRFYHIKLHSKNDIAAFLPHVWP